MYVNINKTHVVHYRKPNTRKTDVKFNYRNREIKVVDSARYLGIDLSEYLNYSVTTNTLADGASRALGALIAKYYSLKVMNFDTYEHIYNTYVTPVLDFASEIWGAKTYTRLETIHNRAIKTFLCVGKTCPTPFIIGDTGWYPSSIRHKVNMAKFWNKLVCCNDEDRIIKKVFKLDCSEANKGTDCWTKDMKYLFSNVNMSHIYENLKEIDVTVVKKAYEDKYKNQWFIDINQMSKLETYRTLECDIKVKDYVRCKFLNYRQRSAISLARSGTLPIEVEKGRWRNIPRESRLCNNCDDNTVEDLAHICIHCTKHDIIRNHYYDSILQDFAGLRNMSDNDQLNIMLTNPKIAKKTANLILCIMKNR